MGSSRSANPVSLGVSSPGEFSPPRPESSRAERTTNRVAIAIFVSLASFYFLPRNIAALVTVFAIIWASSAKVRPERPKNSPPPKTDSEGNVFLGQIPDHLRRLLVERQM